MDYFDTENYTNSNIHFYHVDPSNCMIRKHNTTILTNLYEGIPETLILNVVAWIFLIVLFTLLRQQAWDYGRLALVNSNGENKRWTQIFYAHNEEVVETVDRRNEPPETHAGGTYHQQHNDNKLFSWILITLKLKDEQILNHSGPDACHYLSFQRHLMIVMGAITLISIGIILPVNFQGTLGGDEHSFGHTTVANIDPSSKLLWIHVFVAIGFVPLVVLTMRLSSGRYAGKRAPTRTIMATNVMPADCSRAIIQDFVQQRFPDISVTDVQIAYNIQKLVEVVDEYERVYEARIYCEQHRTRDPVTVRPKCFSCDKMDALEYYRSREEQLHGEVARLRASALNDPLGIVFISVPTTEMAHHIITHFRPAYPREWNLSYAPSPSDIFWENLTPGSVQWYLKWFIVNLMLFLVLFFLTTPVFIVNLLDKWDFTKNATSQFDKISPLVSEFLPTLMLWTLAVVMPAIVAYSEKWLDHWTRSKLNYAIMTKSFSYLLLMILILPSLGLTSADALIAWTFANSVQNETYRWECIFLPDKGAFFVNYVITAAFIGTSFELMRLPELLDYIWQLCSSKSRAETSHIRKSILIEFPFGIHYAWTIMVFTMSTVYSLACPLIMPFAMVYISLKHFVDRHNLYFAYGPSNMISQGGGKIHSTAVTMTKISVILLLIIMAALASLRTGGLDARAVVLIVALIVTLVLFTFMSPIKRCTTRPKLIAESLGPAPIYIADVLMNRRILPDSPQHFNYGSDNSVELTITDDSHSPAQRKNSITT